MHALTLLLAACGRADADRAQADRLSRSTEARLLVQAMADGAALQSARGVAITEPAGPTPTPGSCCGGKGGRCRPAPASWRTTAWLAIRFEVHQPHAYSFEYRPDASGFTALAYGDLDCDGTLSTFSIRGDRGANGMISLGPLQTTEPLE
jgi:hypothetical protein